MAPPSSCDDTATPPDGPAIFTQSTSSSQGEDLGRLPSTSLMLASNSQGDARVSGPDISIGDGLENNILGDHISSSMTPPPSSQMPNIRHSIPIQRAAPISPSDLGSPLATDLNGTRAASIPGITQPPTAQEIADASTEEKTEMIQKLIVDNNKLDNALRESRMEQAHYKLQNTLLTLESEEAIKHLEAEHELTRREVQVLKLAYQGRADPHAPSPEYVSKLKNICKSLETENKTIKRRLERAKKVIEAKEDQLEAAKDTNDRLTQRIRENREHVNNMRSPGRIFHVSTPKLSTNSYPATPQQYRRTPHQTPVSGGSIRESREHGQEPGFAALLAAAHQENNSAPSTPLIGQRAGPRTPIIRHNRGVQSLSSLLTTPPLARPGTANSTLLPSAQFIPHSASRSAYTSRALNVPPHARRRESRDSTISAEDVEQFNHSGCEGRGRGRGRGRRDREHEEIQESRAAQSANEMLRADSRESFEVAASRNNTPNLVTAKSELLQSKIWATVTKPVIEKRKRDDFYGIDHSNKKPRATEPLGLGIGYSAPRA
ncbi:c0fff025-a648-4723-a5e7-a0db4695cbef [Sclerotinia trifoliorum]|uniref:C0fff025-a648-4723-a5e7-a0db4695cbef n=1 Tax=Sclerotinia trifoliorum TaxID=28548 RepID=A0A8H2VNU9_9HELO|nr:c0fff025-a648-4723-a5e7-a0db4695cbef [Sclerotinia trifoliorum]